MINTNRKKNVVLFVFCCMLFNLAQGFSFNPFNKTKTPFLVKPKLTILQKVKTGITFKRFIFGSAILLLALIVYSYLKIKENFGPDSDFQKTLNSTFEEFKELTKKDLNINKVDMLNLTPIDYLLLEKYHRRYSTNIKNKKEKIKFLLENGVDLKKTSNHFLLHSLFKDSDTDPDPQIIQLLIDHKININAKDHLGKNPQYYLMISFTENPTQNKKITLKLLISNKYSNIKTKTKIKLEKELESINKFCNDLLDN